MEQCSLTELKGRIFLFSFFSYSKTFRLHFTIGRDYLVQLDCPRHREYVFMEIGSTTVLLKLECAYELPEDPVNMNFSIQ